MDKEPINMEEAIKKVATRKAEKKAELPKLSGPELMFEDFKKLLDKGEILNVICIYELKGGYTYGYSTMTHANKLGMLDIGKKLMDKEQ